MMTSENNANRLWTKVDAFSHNGQCGHAAFRNTRRVGVLMLTCTIMTACSYRTSDKAVLHARTSHSAVAVDVAGNDAHRSDAGKRPGEQKVAVSPLTERVQNAIKPSVPLAHANSSGDVDKCATPSIKRVVGDASVSLSSLPAEEVSVSVDHADRVHAPATSMQISAALAFDERNGFTFPWTWLLGMAGLGAAGTAAFSLARRRQRTKLQDQTASTKASIPEDVQDMSSVVVAREAEAEPVALTVKDEALAETAPVLFSLLEWSYQPFEHDAREHWDVLAPVDFLPSSWSMPHAPEASDTEVMEEVRVHEQNEAAATPTLTIGDDPLSPLFEHLENIALCGLGTVPVLLIERDNDLPEVFCTTCDRLPDEMLQAWESTLRQAMPDAQSLTLPWLLVHTLLLRAEGANGRDAEALHVEAEEWIELGSAADQQHSAVWTARRIDIDLRRVKRQKGAARLLSLRAIQAHFTPQLVHAEPPVLLAWVDVLTFWAQCQYGDAALARYAEADAICLRLSEQPNFIDAAQRRRAEILRQRATIEEGGARLNSLDAAQVLVDALYERVPSADNALAIALTALARGNALPPDQAKEAYSHALMHAFMAEGEPRLRAESLQCRLAIQWAYENLPGMAVQSNVAINLVARLETLHVQHPDTLQHMAQTYLRNADFTSACELCENAWRSGHATPALLATWQEACRQWEAVSARPEQLDARQQTMRQLSIASAMR